MARVDPVTRVVQPNHELFVFLVVAFEVAVGVLILGRGRWVDRKFWGSTGSPLQSQRPSYPPVAYAWILDILEGMKNQ